jgi:hypothetical protein
VARRLPRLSGIYKRPPCDKKASFQKHMTSPSGQEIGYLGMGEYDTQTLKLIQKKDIFKPLTALVTTITEVQEGKFHPDKENDKLTKALENLEHIG